jgi:hypothetical protein
LGVSWNFYKLAVRLLKIANLEERMLRTVTAIFISISLSTAFAEPGRSSIGTFWQGSFQTMEFADEGMGVRPGGIHWQQVQPSATSGFDFSKTDVDKFVREGKKDVYPLIRVIKDWDIYHHPFDQKFMEHPELPNPKCDARPTDLTDRAGTPDPNKIYSQTFFEFIKAFGKRYPNNFDIIVLGNEQNDPRFACGSMEPGDYIRLLITMKLALKEAGSTARVSDGGLQGFHLNRIAAIDLVEKGRYHEAVTFFRKSIGDADFKTVVSRYGRKLSPPVTFEGMTVVQKAQSILYDRDLRVQRLQDAVVCPPFDPNPTTACYNLRAQRLAEAFICPIINGQQSSDCVQKQITEYVNKGFRGDIGYVRTLQLLQLNMWDYVDVANFHLYEGLDSDRTIIEFIREKVTKRDNQGNVVAVKPIFSNEVGTQPRGSAGTYEATRHAAALLLVKRMAYLKLYDVSPALWFGMYREDHESWFKDGLKIIDPSGNETLGPNFGKIVGAYYAYNTVLSHLNEKHSSAKLDYIRKNNIEVGREIKFDFPGYTVNLVWVHEKIASFTRDIPASCGVTGMYGNVVHAPAPSPTEIAPGTVPVTITTSPTFIRCEKQ